MYGHKTFIFEMTRKIVFKDTYFKDHVTVINPNSTRSIRQGILHEMGASRNMDAIRQFVTSRFNWEVAATQTYEGYRQLLQKNTTV